MATRRYIHFLIPRTCECYLIWPKRNYLYTTYILINYLSYLYTRQKKKKNTKHMIKLRILGNAYPGLSVWVLLLSHVRLFATPWTVACQASLSLELSRQEYWSELPFPSLRDLLDPAIKPESLVYPTLAGEFFTTVPKGP